MNYKRSDGGRADAGIDDSQDCTVRALAHAANIPYDQAHAIMAEDGRRNHKCASMYSGLFMAKHKNILKFTKLEFVKQDRVYVAPNPYGLPITKFHRMVGPNVKQFIESHPSGRYIVRVKRHVFAVVNGVMLDTTKQHGGKLVEAAWEIVLQ